MNIGPAIVVMTTPDAPRKLVTAFCHGCEEEGVPVHVEPAQGSALELARLAAERSELSVGAGIVGHSVVVHERHLAERSLGLESADADESTGRLLGANAARLVKQRPLRTDVHQSAPTERPEPT
jgi:hypothetical protein